MDIKHFVFRRMLSTTIDFIITLVLIGVFSTPAIFSYINVGVDTNPSSVLALFISSFLSGILVFIAMSFYFILLPIVGHGQTFGKKVTNLKIVDKNGNTPDFITMLMREFPRLICLVLTFGLSLIPTLFSLLLSKNHKCFYELLSKTNIIDAKGE